MGDTKVLVKPDKRSGVLFAGVIECGGAVDLLVGADERPIGDDPAVLDPAHKVHLSGRATFIGRVDVGKDLRVIGGRCVVQDPELHLCVGEASTRTRRLISVATGAYLAIAMVCLALIVVRPCCSWETAVSPRCPSS